MYHQENEVETDRLYSIAEKCNNPIWNDDLKANYITYRYERGQYSLPVFHIPFCDKYSLKLSTNLICTVHRKILYS